MTDTYKELLYKNQLDLVNLEEREPEAVFIHTIPIYQNPDIKRPYVDPYEILQNYRLPNGRYKKVVLVHFDKLPEELRGFTDGDRRMNINQADYEPYLVMAHEATHILNRNKPEYWVRAYSPRVRTLDELRMHFPELEFVILR